MLLYKEDLYLCGSSRSVIGGILMFNFLPTGNIKDNGSVLNATCSTFRIDKYLFDVQVWTFKSVLKKEGAS